MCLFSAPCCPEGLNPEARVDPVVSFQTSEMLDGALRSYEDLEFQQLERESRLEEEKEAACQALAQDITQLQNSIRQRKVRSRT